MRILYRNDCIKLLSNCSDSKTAPQAVCDIIAPANTEKYCISISDYLSELFSTNVRLVW